MIQMESRRKRLDDLFRHALVLLGILSASEFSYFLKVGDKAEYPYVFFAFTAPYVLMIGTWIAKELGGDWIRLDMKLLLTEFCWSLWIVTLIYYLVIFWVIRTGQLVEIAAILGLGLTFCLNFLIGHAHKRAYRSMVDYFRRPKWLIIRYIVFMVAYLVVTLVFLPPKLNS